MKFGLYLAGAGSLDGSDIFTAVLAYGGLQQKEWTPVPTARDIVQGEVLNHRFAHEESGQRNSLEESARIVRGDIVDLRDLDTGELDGAVWVGGGGVLSTWTDYHDRGKDCRITERLKFHAREFLESGKPILCLDNACFALAAALRETEIKLTLNPGNNPRLREAMIEYGVHVTDEIPSWDSEHRVGCFPDLALKSDLSLIRNNINQLLDLVDG